MRSEPVRHTVESIKGLIARYLSLLWATPFSEAGVIVEHKESFRPNEPEHVIFHVGYPGFDSDSIAANPKVLERFTVSSARETGRAPNVHFVRNVSEKPGPDGIEPNHPIILSARGHYLSARADDLNRLGRFLEHLISLQEKR